MNEVKQKRLSRVVAGGIVILTLALAFGLLGKAFAYFKTGADSDRVYLINTSILADHNPKVIWQPDEIVDGRVINKYMREELQKAYTQAWHVVNLSMTNKNGDHLEDYFADQALEWIKQEVEGTDGYTLHQIDLNHNLQLHHFALDNQIAAFSDKQVKVIRKVEDELGVVIFEEQQLFDYDVIMTLDDGRWRIRHLVKKLSVMTEEQDTLGAKDKLLVKLNSMRGVNYYPSSTPWFDFWEQYDPEIIKRDLANADSLGLNTVRIFLQYEVFGEANVKKEMLVKLESFLDISEQKGIDVIVTLFDFPKSYDLNNYANTDRHLEMIVSQFKDHKAVLAWDVKNEADLDFSNHGEKLVTDWLSFVIKRIRKYDPDHLITIGWSDGKYGHLLSDELDFVSFHFYKKPEELGEVIKALKQKVPGKKLVLSEFGQSSLSTVLTLYAHSEDNQAEYYERVISVLEEEEVPFVCWALQDFDKAPTEVFGKKPWIRHPQKHYGLYRTDGSPKPVAALLRK